MEVAGRIADTFAERVRALEEATLAPQAVRSYETRGRERAEEPCMVRTPFQRDRDRIVHSKSFRRLKGKTQVFIDPKHNPISRSGWEDIKSVTRGNSKKVTVVFKKTYADWETLVSTGPYAAHIVKGKNMNDMFLTSLPISSGPWKFASWQKGVQITVVKNPAYKASTAMKWVAQMPNPTESAATADQTRRPRLCDLCAWRSRLAQA